MCEAVGHPVRRLVRTRIGPLPTAGSQPGEWRPLSAGRGAAALRGGGARADGEQPRRPRTHRANLRLPMRLQALRGAITCDEDSKAEIDAKTARLVKELLRPQRARPRRRREHHLHRHRRPHRRVPGDRGARRPRPRRRRRCSAPRSRPSPHGTPRCIRVLVHCYTERSRDELHHVFLEGAAALRDRPRRRRLTYATRVSAAPESVALDRHRPHRWLDRPRAAPRRASRCAASTTTPARRRGRRGSARSTPLAAERRRRGRRAPTSSSSRCRSATSPRS